MAQSIFRKLIPHILAIITFLMVALIYCHPTLEGGVLQQHDIVHWKGMAQNAFEYKERTGHFPLWNTNLFSGMPNYQVTTEGKGFIVDFHSIFSLGLPKPVSFFFLACLCFYILTQVLGISSLIGIFTSLAFSYSSYDPIIIAAGHESKMWAIAYMPGVLSGLILLYQRKYFIGLAVATIFATCEIGVNHVQISYYFLIVAIIITIGYIFKWIKARDWNHTFIALSLAALAGFIAFANAAIPLLTTKEYASYTMRGGKSLDINGSEIKKVDTKGLDPDYAFSYSIAKSEILTFFMPNVYGGSSAETLADDEIFIESLTNKNIPEQAAIQLSYSIPKYWGGIIEGTSGPVYLGAIICFLALIGLVVIRSRLKWWILSIIVLSVFMAWGKYFSSFNMLLFEYLPFYNKFRAPSMSLVIPQLLVPLLAAMSLQQLFSADGREQLQRAMKPVLYALGGVFILIGLFYLLADYSANIDSQIIHAYTNPQTGDKESGTLIVNALKASRKAMLAGGIGKAFLFLLVVVGTLYMYLKKWVTPMVAIIILLSVNIIDLLVVDSKYLNEDNYVDKGAYQAENFTPNAANVEILKDKSPHYRVYNLAPDRFNDAITSYFHRSIGGYHAAKLNTYQDIISGQLAKSPPNMAVLNMLDTRYFILPPTDQQSTYSVHRNDDALGAAWFVKDIKYVNGPVEEMEALNHFNPKDTAIIDVSFKDKITSMPISDTTATINLIKYDNDAIAYETSTTANGLAIFSEIYYPAGWNAYIDNVKHPIIKVNYILRGLMIPPGKHKIEFKFEPVSFKTGQRLVYLGNGLLWLSIALAVVGSWRNYRKSENS